MKVLLIEDNPGDARLVQEALEEVDDTVVDVEHESTLSAGLSRLDHGGVDVVLLDLSLPDEQGLETFVRARKRAPEVPIVVLSGMDHQSIALEAVHRGAQDYLVKGRADGDELMRSMRYAIERRRLMKELDCTRHEQADLKNRLLFHVWSELRSPLSLFEHFIGMLLEDSPTDRQREHLDVCRMAAGEMQGMVDELVEAARAEAGTLTVNPRPTRLASLISFVLERFAEQASAKEIPLLSDVPASLPAVEADPERIARVLDQLLDNALRYTPEREAVVVAVRMDDEDPRLVCVSVTNTGSGIPTERPEMVFDPFNQEHILVDGRPHGLGLGLYICKELVQLHGGRIWMRTEAGWGTTICFTLPVSRTAVSVRHEGTRKEGAQARRKA